MNKHFIYIYNFELLMDDSKYLQYLKGFSEHGLGVTAFLGGIAITVLVLVISSPDKF